MVDGRVVRCACSQLVCLPSIGNQMSFHDQETTVVYGTAIAKK